jgi:hypothetical protein
LSPRSAFAWQKGDESNVLAVSSAARTLEFGYTRRTVPARCFTARRVDPGTAAQVLVKPSLAAGELFHSHPEENASSFLNRSTGFANAGIAGSGKASVVHDACGPASGFSMTLLIGK